MILPDFGSFAIMVIGVMIPLGIGFIAGYYTRKHDEKQLKK
jgi:uncharacterized protein YneF (UPF0154 family)